MGLIINQDKITPALAAELIKNCPFGGLKYENGLLSLTAGCKSCKLCVKACENGAIVWEQENSPAVDKSAWTGIAVYCELRDKQIHPVTLELIGKARELSRVTGHPVYSLVIGSEISKAAQELLHYGVNKVFVYDSKAFEHFTILPYTAAFYDFIQRIKPSSVLVGATNLGRSLAPRVAARCNTGLTADCTVLEMKDNTDLVQIRPAFGGNIMAQIVTPNVRPQFCTARYKVFSAPERNTEKSGDIVQMKVTPEMEKSGARTILLERKPPETDISESEVIVACGRGFAKKADIAMAQELAELLHGQLAGTRPMIESGWLSPKRQIGLSGRTVKPKLIITLGISGSVQFAAGMKSSDYIISVNKDKNAAIFDIAHLCVVGDLYEILPEMIRKIKENTANV